MRYIIGFLIGIGLIVLTFVLIFKAFSGGGSKPQTIDLNSYANTDAVMRFTIDGPINSDQNHHRVRVTVGRDLVTLEEINGYQGKLQLSKTYPNNPDAYADFLHALTIAGYTSGNTSAAKDERGYCPTGRRYIYEALSSGDNALRWWSTSCGTQFGNFKGKPDTVRILFQQQVPDYDQETAHFATS